MGACATKPKVSKDWALEGAPAPKPKEEEATASEVKEIVIAEEVKRAEGEITGDGAAKEQEIKPRSLSNLFHKGEGKESAGQDQPPPLEPSIEEDPPVARKPSDAQETKPQEAENTAAPIEKTSKTVPEAPAKVEPVNAVEEAPKSEENKTFVEEKPATEIVRKPLEEKPATVTPKSEIPEEKKPVEEDKPAAGSQETEKLVAKKPAVEDKPAQEVKYAEIKPETEQLEAKKPAVEDKPAQEVKYAEIKPVTETQKAETSEEEKTEENK